MLNENAVNNNEMVNDTETAAVAVASAQNSDITALFANLDVKELNDIITMSTKHVEI